MQDQHSPNYTGLKALKVSLMQEKDFRCRVRKEERAEGCVLIENVCVAWYLLKATNASDAELINLRSDPASAAELIKSWRKTIKEGEAEGVMVSMCGYLDEIQSVLESRIEGAELSEAFRFIRAMEHKGIPVQPNEHVDVPFYQYSNGKRDHGSHPLLQELVSIDELRERLQISMVTLNKYLEDSGIPVIRFSAKSRWLRSGDCQKFLDYFTTEGRGG